jgi:hypothetical protein
MGLMPGEMVAWGRAVSPSSLESGAGAASG